MGILEEINLNYHKLAIMVGSENQSVFLDLGQQMVKKYDYGVINLNLELTKQLLQVPGPRIPFSVSKLIQTLVSDQKKELVILNHIEVLFLPDLKQNPLHILKQLARTQPLLVIWPGDYESGKLQYAKPGHVEYYQQAYGDVLVYEIIDDTITSLGSGENL